jgi:putative transposase
VERRFRGSVAVDETVVKIHGLRAYIWSAVDVDSGEILAIHASRGRNMLIALKFLRMVFG